MPTLDSHFTRIPLAATAREQRIQLILPFLFDPRSSSAEAVRMTLTALRFNTSTGSAMAVWETAEKDSMGHETILSPPEAYAKELLTVAERELLILSESSGGLLTYARVSPQFARHVFGSHPRVVLNGEQEERFRDDWVGSQAVCHARTLACARAGQPSLPRSVSPRPVIRGWDPISNAPTIQRSGSQRVGVVRRRPPSIQLSELDKSSIELFLWRWGFGVLSIRFIRESAEDGLTCEDLAELSYHLSHRAFRVARFRKQTPLFDGNPAADARWRVTSPDGSSRDRSADEYVEQLLGCCSDDEHALFGVLDQEFESGFRRAGENGEEVPPEQANWIRALGRLQLLSGVLPEDADWSSQAFRDGKDNFPVLRPVTERIGREGLSFTLEELCSYLLDPLKRLGGMVDLQRQFFVHQAVQFPRDPQLLKDAKPAAGQLAGRLARLEEPRHALADRASPGSQVAWLDQVHLAAYSSLGTVHIVQDQWGAPAIDFDAIRCREALDGHFIGTVAALMQRSLLEKHQNDAAFILASTRTDPKGMREHFGELARRNAEYMATANPLLLSRREVKNLAYGMARRAQCVDETARAVERAFSNLDQALTLDAQTRMIESEQKEQERLSNIEIFIVGAYATEVSHVLASAGELPHQWHLPFVVTAMVVAMLLTAWATRGEEKGFRQSLAEFLRSKRWLLLMIAFVLILALAISLASHDTHKKLRIVFESDLSAM